MIEKNKILFENYGNLKKIILFCLTDRGKKFECIFFVYISFERDWLFGVFEEVSAFLDWAKHLNIFAFRWPWRLSS